MDGAPDCLNSLAALLADGPLRRSVLDDDPANALYEGWYLGQRAPVPPWQGPPLAALFRAAHADAEVFDDGWVVLDDSGLGTLLLGKGQQQREAAPGDYVNPRRPLVPPAPGERVLLVRRVDRLDESGWWATRSPAGEPAGPLGRYYLHPQLTDAATVLAAVTAGLNALPVRWSLKLPTWPEGFARNDALVVYVQRPDASAVAAVLQEIRGLGERLPPLTRRLSPTLAYADDPGPQTSYGMLVCAALAPAARGVARQRPADPADTLRRGLVEAGLDPAAPWRLP